MSFPVSQPVIPWPTWLIPNGQLEFGANGGECLARAMVSHHQMASGFVFLFCGEAGQPRARGAVLGSGWSLVLLAQPGSVAMVRQGRLRSIMVVVS